MRKRELSETNKESRERFKMVLSGVGKLNRKC